jgi:hypothetical protein
LRGLKIPLLRNSKAVSYTISALIITATTISLVLVASIYAYQILERQRGIAEFDVAKESLLAYNDALENVAWKPQAARSARFTIEYGFLELIPNFGSLSINATIDSSPMTLYSNTTGAIRYNIKNQYVTFGSGYKSYLIGNESVLITESTGSYGIAVVEQQTSWVTITLFYRVRAMRTSVIEVGGENINYVDVWVIKLEIGEWYSYVHDFDLTARCLQVQTTPYGPYNVAQNGTSTITARVGALTSSASVPLTAGKVVFNVIVAEVQVSV